MKNRFSFRIPEKTLRSSSMLGVLAFLSACGGSGGNAQPAAQPPQSLVCDDTMKTAFAPDANTTVVAVKSFKKNDALVVSGTATASTPKAANDICLVTLNVGPGNPGPAGAPSTSPGIAIDVWLPAKANWNNRVHNYGSGGFAGKAFMELTTTVAADTAGVEGAVSSVTDTGHATDRGSFAMNPDGSISKTQWIDFASRAAHEQAVKTKALATAYYGSAPKYSYFEGNSKGGQQGHSLAQNFPGDYDGIVANHPAVNWTRFFTAGLYPQVVFQRDLGGVPLSKGQQDLMSNAAIASCDVVGGQHLGYILDPGNCTYDPAKDANVLCTSAGGSNTTSSCVTTVQATAMNKIWYGMTTDGSVPSPATDTGWGSVASPAFPAGTLKWWGLARGTATYGGIFNLFGVRGHADPTGPWFGLDMVALQLQNPTLAEPAFLNATGNGQSLWTSLSYAQLANSFDRGVALQSEFANINTDNPDLSAFKSRGGKMLMYHGLADELIMPQNSINYYNRVASQMGGFANVQSFYRFWLVPGVGHAHVNGTTNPNAAPPSFATGQLYNLVKNWVENGVAPDQVVLDGPTGATAPACLYPRKITYTTGNPALAASYVCS